MVPKRCPVVRSLEPSTSGEARLPMLPDDCLEKIVQLINPTELVAAGWHSVSFGFSVLIERHLMSCTTFDLTDDPLYEMYRPVLDNDLSLFPRHRRLLKLLMKRFFANLTDFALPIGLFSYIREISETDGTDIKCLASLKKLTLYIGGEDGHLNLSEHFDHLRSARLLFGDGILSEINLSIKITEDEKVTCCGLRDLVRFLNQVANSETKWNITINDCTMMGQGTFNPTELARNRNKAFVCYVRALLDVGIALNSLTLKDCHKPSPYMLIMLGGKNRSLYMYPEFKRCRHLSVCYDVGNVQPLFGHENDRFDLLEGISIEESHVLYRDDLVRYLRNAPNLRKMQVILPSTWSQRVSRCHNGCFTNPNYDCFKAQGWTDLVSSLPNIEFQLTEPPRRRHSASI